MEPELIICASVYIPELNLMFNGHRHNHARAAMNDQLSYHMNRQEIGKLKVEQGFTTSKNRFVDREEAYHIAKESNQLLPCHD